MNRVAPVTGWPVDFFRRFLEGFNATATGAPQRVNGHMAASKSPGLGIKPKLDVLGKRVVEIC